MSPTEAMKVAAVWTLTPGTLISRSTSGQASACLAISRSNAATSASRKSTWRRQPSSVNRSSTGELQLRQPATAALAEAVSDRRALAEVAR